MNIKNKIRILAIETSCDETAAAVISENESGQPVVLSNIISSQIDLHAKTGGVVPEVASRAHMEAITPVIALALLKSQQTTLLNLEKKAKADNCEIEQFNENCNLKIENYQEAISLLADITHVAVTNGPGLIGSLLVGFNAAKSIAYAKNIPFVPINHIEGHIYSAFAEISNSEFLNPKQVPNAKSQVVNNIQDTIFDIQTADFRFPLLALTVSGGHTSLTLVKDHLKYENIGHTLDDAAGEAFDKVAKLLNLGYPGGPAVSKLASKYRKDNQTLRSVPQSIKLIFPRPIINDGTFNFSFSGLKTAVLLKIKEWLKAGKLKQVQKGEICAAFEEAAVDVLCMKTMKAAAKYEPKAIILAGGVSANQYLQAELKKRIDSYNSSTLPEDRITFHIPPPEMTGDNAAMIGLAAYLHIKKGNLGNYQGAKVDSNLHL